MKTPPLNMLGFMSIRLLSFYSSRTSCSSVQITAKYVLKYLDDEHWLFCHIKSGTDPMQQCFIALYLSSVLLDMCCFHTVIGHTWSKRLQLTLKYYWYHHPQLNDSIDRSVCMHVNETNYLALVMGFLQEWSELITMEWCHPWSDWSSDGQLEELSSLGLCPS